MSKRLLSLLCALTLLFSAAGCSAPAAAENADNTPDLPAAQEPELPPASGGGEADAPEPEAPPEPAEPEDNQKPEDSAAKPPSESGEGWSGPATDKPMVALTYDDGPHSVYTDQLLDILEENQAVATFFEVGRNLYNDPDAVRRAEALGCEVGSHSYRHADLSKLSQTSLAEDLRQADEVFTEVLGHAPTLLRPPYGALSKAVKYTTGRSIVTWSIDTEDWLSRDVDKILAAVRDAGSLDGQVILMHSTYETSVEASAILIPLLRELGYQLVTVSELITQYYGDEVLSNGTYGYSYFKNGKDVILPPEPEAPPQPSEPQEPQEPQEPDVPDEPQEPAEPEEPREPSAPEEPGADSGQGSGAPGDLPAGEGEPPAEDAPSAGESGDGSDGAAAEEAPAAGNTAPDGAVPDEA